MKCPNIGSSLLQNWFTKCNNETNGSEIGKFLKSTKTSFSTSYSGTTSSSPVGDNFMYIETSQNNHGKGVFVCFERKVDVQISNKKFIGNRFS